MENLLQESYTQSSVRALMWSFGSPSIVSSASDARWQDDIWCSWRALELAGLWDKPGIAEELNTFLNNEKDHRLGARFERLIEFGLHHLPGYECVQRRLQVNFERQTRGEFDFIVRDHEARRLEHWEVACKFYLGVPMEGQLHWVGPGKQDSLIRKLNTLTHRQLVLSQSPEAVDTVNQLDEVPSNVRALLKGRLFYPLADEHVHDAAFEFAGANGSIGLNRAAPFGFWCDYDQLVASEPKSLFNMEKSLWLDPSTQKREELKVGELLKLVETAPCCVDVVTRNNQAQRWFVVAPGWFTDLDPSAIS
ncbi:MAG: DUF1853 family protein [Gammaproteobacteria bacterium]